MNAFSQDYSWCGLELLIVSPTPTHPQDHGNRRRIYEVCTWLKMHGARIHFVHYASEHDWRRWRSTTLEIEMQQTWDTYHLVSPSRPLHSAPVGSDHKIDEWADPNLSSYLEWACSVRQYDAAIVNYTWLSFCLDHIPANVFKILDTHDQFSDRRLLLESAGIAPEFFYTTKEEEAKGLARANLVWAIKKDEEDYFKHELNVENCITVLHAERHRDLWRKSNSNVEPLRIGIVGARNNINRVNIEAFLSQLLPSIRYYMAPLEVLIAGGCCVDLLHYSDKHLRLVGRVADLDDFYSSIDVAAVPMEFSTGLKIKAAEALAAGIPVVGHRHAMEGYPNRHKLHQLSSFAEMTFELIKLSFDRSPLKSLAEASDAICAEVGASVEKSMKATRHSIAQHGKKLVILLSGEALNSNPIVLEHLYSVAEYFRFLADITVYVDGVTTASSLKALEALELSIKVVVNPACRQALAKDAVNWTFAPFYEWLASNEISIVYFMCEPAGIVLPSCVRRTYIRHELVALSGGSVPRLIDKIGGTAEIVVIANRVRELNKFSQRYGVKHVRKVPLLRAHSKYFFTRSNQTSVGLTSWLVALPTFDDEIVAVIEHLASEIGASCLFVDAHDVASVKSLLGTGVLDWSTSKVLNTCLFIDATSGAPLAGLLQELVALRSVPVVNLRRGAGAFWPYGSIFETQPATLLGLSTLLARLSIDLEFARSVGKQALDAYLGSVQNDAGWCWLWSEIGTGWAGQLDRLDSKPEDPLAALFK